MQENEKTPCWHIAGIGAVGSVVASYFEQAKLPLRLIVKDKEQLKNYQNTKLTVIQDNHRLTCHPQAISIDEIGNEQIKYLICCLKAYDIASFLQRFKNHFNKDSVIILLHNGLGVLEEIKAHLPSLRIISGICTLGAHLEKPFTVRAFLDGKIYLGKALGEFSRSEIKIINNAFQDAQLPCQWEENIYTRLWEKFAFNCSINLLTAVYACKNGGLLAHSDLLKNITCEIADVLNAWGVAMSGKELLQKIMELLKRVGENYSSMYKDVHHQKPTELRYLNSYLVELAKQKGIPTPINNKLLTLFYEKYPTYRARE